MPAPGRVHDRTILDALEAIGSSFFSGRVWRVVRSGRDSTKGSIAHGRWSPQGEFEVLYTSLMKEGAIQEIGYRLSLEPVWPSRIQHDVHELEIETARTLQFANLEAMKSFGIQPELYGTFDYAVTQSIAAAAQFLGFDGLLVPNARYSCMNLIVFLEQTDPGFAPKVISSEEVDWEAWRAGRRRPSAR